MSSWSREKLGTVSEILARNLVDERRLQPLPNGFALPTGRNASLRFEFADERDAGKLLRGRIDGQIPDDKGFVFDSLSSNTRRRLEAVKLSYFVLDGDFCLYIQQRVLRSSKSRAFAPNSKLSKQASALQAKVDFDSDALLDLPGPTDIISPYGLDVLDVICRLDRRRLDDYSAYGLSKEFGLRQPRLFRMMASLRTKSLGDFRLAVERLPRAWWKRALTYPRTNQRLRSFNRLEQIYTASAEANSDDAQLFETIESIRNSHGPNSILYGPIEVLKRVGFFQTDEVQLWITSDDAQRELKKQLRLIPATMQLKGRRISLAILGAEGDLHSQCILSPAPRTGSLNLDIDIRELNHFRVVWDACNSDSRAQAAALDYLEERLLR